MAKTVHDHIKETTEITRHLADGDALVIKLRDELKTCRTAIEFMAGYNHPDFRRHCSYATSYNPVKESGPATLKEIADYRVKAINALLGDKA
jgi:hypothetical protein